MNQKTKTILISVLIIAFLIRVLFLSVSSVPWWDEAVYTNLGEDLSENPLDYSVGEREWSDFIPSGGDSNYAWPKMGFRPPLLPYLISLFFLVNAGFLVKFLMPLVGTLGVLSVYLLGKEFFNEKVGMISFLIFAFVPIHVFYSSMVLNGILVTSLLSLSVLFFWRGFEKGDKKSKILFGVFLGLSLLARYTTLWMFPVFFFYFLIKHRSFSFLRDRYLWYSIGSFLLVLVPWFIYGFFEYGNIFGGFIHGAKAAAYWGGNQAWYFFFQNNWEITSILGVLFVFALVYILAYRKYKLKGIYFNLLWFFIFLFFLLIMPHKENRFVIPLLPAMSVISGYFISKIKRFRKIIILILVIVMLFSCFNMFMDHKKISENINTKCFLKTTDFLEERPGDFVVVSENPAILRSFVKQENTFYPSEINREKLEDICSNNERVFFVFNRLNSGFEDSKWRRLKGILSSDYKFEYNCSMDPERNFVYSC